MHHPLKRAPYRRLQAAFHAWAEEKQWSLGDRNASSAYLMFRDSLPEHKLNGLEVPEKLTIYAMFRKNEDFFTPFKGCLPAHEGKAKGGNAGRKDFSFAVEVRKDLGVLAERIISAVVKAQKVKDQGGRMRNLELKNRELKKQLLAVQKTNGRLEKKTLAIAKKLDAFAIYLKGKGKPSAAATPVAKRPYHRKHKHNKKRQGGDSPPNTDKGKKSESPPDGDDEIASPPSPPPRRRISGYTADKKFDTTVFDLQGRDNAIVNCDCAMLLGLPTREAQREECRKEAREKLYIIAGGVIYYSLMVIRQFIRENNIRDEKSFLDCHRRIKKPEFRGFYPIDTKKYYKKSVQEIIKTVFPR
jgi:hypothetical protein